MAEKKSVCIIGGGPAGLVSLKRVLDSPFLTGTLFEQKDDVGGVWHYKKGEKTFGVSQENLSSTSTPQADPECTTTMYDDLTANLPHPLMQFVDFPHEAPPGTFLTQQEIHDYLTKYANHFNLQPHIQLNTSVISVRPETPINPENLGEPGRWVVETHNHKDDIRTTTVFDAVMVCVGKNAYPYQPPVFPGLDEFEGEVMHSKYFKNQDVFQDKSVVLIGLGPSSADLALHISTTAKQITVCHKFIGGFGLGLMPQNVKETTNVKKITKNGVTTVEDEDIACDIIIFCTGFGLKFPFFREDSGIKVLDEKYIPNMYKMTIFTKRPSLAILNLCYRTPEFLLVEVQAKYFVASLEYRNDFKLPTYQEMEASVKEEEEEKIAKGWLHSHWFQIGEYGWGAMNYFEKMCEEIPGVKKEICGKWPLLEVLLRLVFLQRIFGKLALYKKDRFRYVEENVWEYECSSNRKLFPEVKGEVLRMTLDEETGTVSTETKEIKY